MSGGDVDRACRRCRLHRDRTNVVRGVGPRASRIMFIGEAPGKDEDLKGVPFVGRAGKLLDEALRESMVSREQVWISNLVKCRPPGNRRPRKDEREVCASLYLNREIEKVRPEVICALGQTVAEHLSGRKVRMSEAVGTEEPLAVEGVSARLFITYHPAACLYQRGNTKTFKEGVRASLTAAGLGKRRPGGGK